MSKFKIGDKVLLNENSTGFAKFYLEKTNYIK